MPMMYYCNRYIYKTGHTKYSIKALNGVMYRIMNNKL